MKLSAQEEYGLRCLLRLAAHETLTGEGMTLSEISQAEGLSVPYVAKLMRILRIEELVESERGHTGGYRLARPVDQITANQAIAALGGRLYDSSFCEAHTAEGKRCTHYIGCSIRPLWHRVQSIVDRELSRITIEDLLGDTTMPPGGPGGGLLQIASL